jgi:hypothetical protein
MKQRVPILMVAIALCGCTSGPNWKRQAFAFSLAADPPATHATEMIAALSRVSISPTFQSRSFTYRTGENSYEQDPYAGFLIPPERALAEPIRAWMRSGGVFGRVAEPGSGVAPTLMVEVSINELYGDFRNPSHPIATMGLHVMCYEMPDGIPKRVVFDMSCSHETPMARKTPAALMAAWDMDLREIMTEINSEYAKTISKDR